MSVLFVFIMLPVVRGSRIACEGVRTSYVVGTVTVVRSAISNLTCIRYLYATALS